MHLGTTGLVSSHISLSVKLFDVQQCSPYTRIVGQAQAIAKSPWERKEGSICMISNGCSYGYRSRIWDRLGLPSFLVSRGVAENYTSC